MLSNFEPSDRPIFVGCFFVSKFKDSSPLVNENRSFIARQIGNKLVLALQLAYFHRKLK